MKNLFFTALVFIFSIAQINAQADSTSPEIGVKAGVNVANIVGDDIDKAKLHNFLKSLEAEVGKEIKFGLMEKEEFEYRFGMFDRFVRVILEGPHEKLINKLGL